MTVDRFSTTKKKDAAEGGSGRVFQCPEPGVGPRRSEAKGGSSGDPKPGVKLRIVYQKKMRRGGMNFK
jgi:hypothetical protein